MFVSLCPPLPIPLCLQAQNSEPPIPGASSVYATVHSKIQQGCAITPHDQDLEGCARVLCCGCKSSSSKAMQALHMPRNFWCGAGVGLQVHINLYESKAVQALHVTNLERCGAQVLGCKCCSSWWASTQSCTIRQSSWNWPACTTSALHYS